MLFNYFREKNVGFDEAKCLISFVQDISLRSEGKGFQ